jgi:hypothetical protein
MMTAPAARSRETTNASSGSAPSNAGDPAVVGMPATPMLSLTRTGTPSSGPRGPFAARAASLAAASPRASRFTVMTACSAGFRWSMR